MESYIEDFLLYKNFGSMPNNGGTDDQPYEWMEAMFAIQIALNKVEDEEERRERAEQEKANKQKGGNKGKQQFSG